MCSLLYSRMQCDCFQSQVGHPEFVREWNRSSTAEKLFKSQWVAVELTSSSLIPYRIRSEWLLSPENSDFPKNEAESLINKEKSGKNSAWELFCSGFLAYVLSASEIGCSKRQSILAEVSGQITAGMGIIIHIPVSSCRQSRHLTNILKI